MVTTSPAAPLVLPFVGRTRETAELRRLHALQRHALILGPAGVGKTALVAHLQPQLRFLRCPHSEHLGEICASLERELGLTTEGLRLVERKPRLRQALAQAGRTVVLDGVGWTTPKLCSWLETVMARTPVWLCTRSAHPWDIGHAWRLLVRFQRVELQALRAAETQALVEAAVQGGLVPPQTRSLAAWLQRRSGGNPRKLYQFLAELNSGHYDLDNPLALRRLEMDRRIHEAFPPPPPA